MFSSRSSYGLLISLFLTLSHLITPLAAQRLPTHLDDAETFLLKGTVRPAVERGLLRDEGRVHSSQKMPRMSLYFSRTPAQETDLAQLLTAQQNRRSPQYHKFLTPEQYAVRFGLSSSDLAPIVSWLEESGFSDVQVARGGMWVSFSGTAGQAESAFHLSLRNYSFHGQTRFANATDPQLPKALSGIVRGVGGLQNFALQSRLKRSHPQFTSGTGQAFLAPDDWATVYDVQPLYGAGLDGSAVTIAVVGQSDVSFTDLRAFRTAAGLSAKDPTVLVPPGSVDPGIQTQNGDEVESDLDLEWAGAIARNASILFVTASATHGNGIFDSIAYVVDNNAAPIMTISYGGCEADLSAGFITSEESVFQQAAAEGITVLVSSGDAGATACDQDVTEQAATHGLAVSYPASSQYVTAVGGTDFNPGYSSSYWSSTNNSYGGSLLSYIPEVVWNDGFQKASGGGASSVLPKPAWQTGTGVPADNARDVPDVAFTAGAAIPYLICKGGGCTNGFADSGGNFYLVGGTSAAAPSFAGLLALVIQKGGSNRFGNINTNLYSLAQISPNAFHDITSGNNSQNCQQGTPDCNAPYIGYDAAPGYDQATGLGSVDAYNFAQQWFGDFSIASNPTSLTIQPGTSAVASVSVIPQNNFAGQVTFSCSVAGTLIDVTCSVPSGSVFPNSSTTVTISAAVTAKTPWWKRHWLPPVNPTWALLMLAIFALAAWFYQTRQRRVPYQSFLYAGASLSLVIIAVGAVSCGGGGTPVSTAPSAPAPPGPLTVTCNLPNATYGVAYSGSCSASGGTGPYTYSGYLPEAFSLNSSTGAVTGTPMYVGPSSPFFVTVNDSENPSQTAQVSTTITSVVTSTVSISCQLPAAVTGVAYSAACTGSGGILPLYYGISSGLLPAGLVLNPTTGTITGTPLDAGTFSFVITVTDPYPDHASASFTDNGFFVSPGPLVTSCSLPAGMTGSYYAGGCSATGGSAPVDFTISAGALPAGVELNPSGQLNGIPTNSGTSSFTITAIDSGSPQQTTSINQSIIITPGQLTLNCFFSAANVGNPFTSFCSGNGGNLPYTFSISSGALPAGLTLDGSSGFISGVPAVAGTSSFTVKVSDGSIPAQTAVYSGSLVVQPTPALTLTCQSQPLMGNLAAQFTGSCSANGGNSPYTAAIIAGTLPRGLSLSVNSGGINFPGAPLALGTTTATLQVTDSSVPAMTATTQVTFTIGPRLQESGLVTITATSGGITNTTTIAVGVP